MTTSTIPPPSTRMRKFDGIEYDDSKELEFKPYVLGPNGYMVALLQDGFVRGFVINACYHYHDGELDPLQYREVDGWASANGGDEIAYQSMEKLLLDKFEDVFVRRHGWIRRWTEKVAA